MRMIDADKLNEKIKMPEYAEQNNLYNIGYHNALEFVKFLIEIYTFDVELVKHGKWMGTVCTACGESDSLYFNHDFCPNCGARMDGDENDNKTESDKSIADNAYLSKRWLETR